MPARNRVAGERHVDALAGQTLVELRRSSVGLALVDGGLEPLAHGVQAHAGLAVAHLAQRELQVARPAQEADADVLELGRRGSLRNRASGLGSRGPPRPSASVSSACERFYDAIAPLYDEWSRI